MLLWLLFTFSPSILTYAKVITNTSAQTFPCRICLFFRIHISILKTYKKRKIQTCANCLGNLDLHDKTRFMAMNLQFPDLHVLALTRHKDRESEHSHREREREKEKKSDRNKERGKERDVERARKRERDKKRERNNLNTLKQYILTN